MTNTINYKADSTQIFSNISEEEFIFVENSPKEKGDSKRSSPIRLSLIKGEKLLHIRLGSILVDCSESETPEKPENKVQSQIKITFENLVKFMKCQKISKIKITSSDLIYETSASFSSLLTLLLNIRTNTEFEFLVADEKIALVQSLNILLFAALKHSKKLSKIALNLSYSDFNHEDFTKVLGRALYRARRLQDLELKMNGKTIPFVRIFNGVMNGQKRFKKTLQRLVINCQNFDDRASILRIFTALKNVRHLEFKANKIDICDKILLRLLKDPTVIQKFETLDLSLRNKDITNYGAKKFVGIDYPNTKEIKLDFGDSSVNGEAFDGLIAHEAKNFPEAEKIEIDVQDTLVKEKTNEKLKYFVKRNSEGPDDDGESSLTIVKKEIDEKDIYDE